MIKQLTILTTIGILIPGAVFSQKNNRISVQSGLINCYFDGTSVINKPKVNDFLFDSKGIELMRRINKSQIAVEYMSLNWAHKYIMHYDGSARPQFFQKQYKYISAFYSRLFTMNEKWLFHYGLGATYSRGDVLIYHYSYQSSFGTESFETGFEFEDIGINAKTGIEFSPKNWLTFYSNFNFLGSIYQKNDVEPSNLYKNEYGMTNTTNKYLVALRFGIGFNF